MTDKNNRKRRNVYRNDILRLSLKEYLIKWDAKSPEDIAKYERAYWNEFTRKALCRNLKEGYPSQKIINDITKDWSISKIKERYLQFEKEKDFEMEWYKEIGKDNE